MNEEWWMPSVGERISFISVVPYQTGQELSSKYKMRWLFQLKCYQHKSNWLIVNINYCYIECRILNMQETIWISILKARLQSLILHEHAFNIFSKTMYPDMYLTERFLTLCREQQANHTVPMIWRPQNIAPRTKRFNGLEWSYVTVVRSARTHFCGLAIFL